MASEETTSIFRQLCAQPANKKCIDCDASNPQWASAKFGCYFCLECSGRHRGLGVHIDFVRSITMDSWKPTELRRMQLGGNDRFLKYLMSKGVHELPIDRKYTNRDVLLYREQLSCESENRTFNAARALEEIVAMEQDIEARKQQMASRQSASVGGGYSAHRDNDAFSWDALTQTTTTLWSKAVESTTQIATGVQDRIREGGVYDSIREKASSVSATTRQIVQRIRTPGTEQGQSQPQQEQDPSASGSDTVWKARASRAKDVTKDLTYKGIGVLSSTWATCLSSATMAVQSLKLQGRPAGDDSEDEAQVEQQQPRSRVAVGNEGSKDLSDLLGDDWTGQPEPSRADDERGLDDLLGFSRGNDTGAQQPTSQVVAEADRMLDALLAGGDDEDQWLTSAPSHTSLLGDEVSRDEGMGLLAKESDANDVDWAWAGEGANGAAAKQSEAKPDKKDTDWAWSEDW
eukprot:c18224_g1_i1.p1 GENE.c18224_g1_i1~~c18224_g1_i1.p1  ORF type:complete len:460 (+),score=69.39 c18224_g1_i1:42-1421(+)